MSSDIVAEIRSHLTTMAPHQRTRLTARQLTQAADEIERLRLTEEEREAVQAAAVMLDARNRLGGPVMFRGSERANTLYGLLARCATGHQE